jgi:hypothetical protein
MKVKKNKHLKASVLGKMKKLQKKMKDEQEEKAFAKQVAQQKAETKARMAAENKAINDRWEVDLENLRIASQKLAETKRQARGAIYLKKPTEFSLRHEAEEKAAAKAKAR